MLTLVAAPDGVAITLETWSEAEAPRRCADKGVRARRLLAWEAEGLASVTDRRGAHDQTDSKVEEEEEEERGAPVEASFVDDENAEVEDDADVTCTCVGALFGNVGVLGEPTERVGRRDASGVRARVMSA